MNNRDYTISVLEDYSRLDEVYRLTHDSLVNAGEIEPKEDGRFITCPNLDMIPETTILIAEQNCKIIGSISFTLDGPNGVHTDNWFKDETDEIRNSNVGVLGSSWRVATTAEFRGNRRFVLDLMKNAFQIGIENNCDVCLFTFLDKHVDVYQRIMRADIVKKKVVLIDGKREADVNMMKIDVEEGWGTFKKLCE
ncbi:MAG: hypothetical protein KAQ91_01630 [Methylococcales bacterium]|nr:hypothetical protein [Methylococcales bacterium]